MAEFGLHWVRMLRARRHDYEGAPLQIELSTGYYSDDMDSTLHTLTLYFDNDALTKDLVDAINGVVAKHAAPKLEAAE